MSCWLKNESMQPSTFPTLAFGERAIDRQTSMGHSANSAMVTNCLFARRGWQPDRGNCSTTHARITRLTKTNDRVRSMDVLRCSFSDKFARGFPCSIHALRRLVLVFNLSMSAIECSNPSRPFIWSTSVVVPGCNEMKFTPLQQQNINIIAEFARVYGNY